MRFEKLTNEVFGAANAGYHVDLNAERIVDNEVVERIMRRRGESAVNDLFDGLAAYDGDLYRGEDGELYAVEFDYGSNAPYQAVAWQRVTRD